MTTTNQGRRTPLSRIFSLEGAMAAFGLYSLAAGLWHGEAVWIFWGGTILVGLGLLMLVRRRDWQKHWEEMAPGAGRESRQPEGRQDGPRGEERHD